MDRRSWPDAAEVAQAWKGVTDDWIVRRNKAHADKQFEVVHRWGDGPTDDTNHRVIERHARENDAHDRASELEDAARGAAVLALFQKWKPQDDGCS